MYAFQHGCAHGGRYDDSISFEKDAMVVGDLVAVVPKGLSSNWNIRSLFWPSILNSVCEISECWVCLCALFQFFQFGFGDG